MSFLSELGGHFESSSGTTQQWSSFYRKACNFFKKALVGVGTKLEMSKGHFYFSGFFTANNGQVYYFSISDVRYFPEKKLLIRMAKGYKDYSGGMNGYVPIDSNLSESLKKVIKHHE